MYTARHSLQLTLLFIFLTTSTGTVGSTDTAELTPLGAELKGNTAGTIPAWTGGLEQRDLKNPEAGYQDPFADDRPSLVITADNLSEHARHLSPAQQAMLKRYPQSFRMPVYPTRRSAAYPEAVYEAVARNAETADLEGSDGLSGAATGPAFPQPKTGAEAIWNHKTRYATSGVRFHPNAAMVRESGRRTLFGASMEISNHYARQGADPENLDNTLSRFIHQQHSPLQLAGITLLGHERINPEISGSEYRLYVPGQSRIFHIDQDEAGYDTSSSGTGNMLTADQVNGFSGPLDRYDWELVGKRELYIPYNAYRLEDKSLALDDILQPRHLPPELLRYELHRVWVVEARVRQGQTHRYARRTFYLDEDSWSIALVDVYDADGELLQLQESHLFTAYDVPLVTTAMGVVYPFDDSRYVALNTDNEAPVIRFYAPPDDSELTPAALEQMLED